MASGAKASTICNALSIPFGYGVTSEWNQLIECNGYMLFFGASLKSMTFVHHVETIVGVPHLYNKIYNVPIVDVNGTKHDLCVCPVRYLNNRFPIIYDLTQMEQEMIAQGVAKEGHFENMQFFIVGFSDALVFLIDKLKNDPFYLLSEPPTFVLGLQPMDGITGPEDKNFEHK
jgi:aminoglycoside 3-N-acetyltransferase